MSRDAQEWLASGEIGEINATDDFHTDRNIKADLMVVGENTQYLSAATPEYEGLHLVLAEGGLVAGVRMPTQHWTWSDEDVSEIELTTSEVEILDLYVDQDLLPEDSTFQFSGHLRNNNLFTGDKQATFSMYVDAVEVDFRVVRRGIGDSEPFVFNGPILNTVPSGAHVTVTMKADGTGLELMGTLVATKVLLTKAQNVSQQVAAAVEGFTDAGIGPATTVPVIQTARVGDASGEVQLSADRGARLTGNSTCWKDMVLNVFGRRLYATTGKVDFDWEENAIIFQPGGNINTTADRVQGNFQIDHDMRVSSTGIETITFYPHFHWLQFNDTMQATIVAEFRLLRNGIGSDGAWTSITVTTNDSSDTFPFNLDGELFMPQITSFPPISMVCGVSDTFQAKVARTDSNSGDLLMYFLDAHGEVDSLGSDEIITKTY